MSFLVPPPLKPSDELDALLRAYFEREMPKPWPSPRVSLDRVVPLRRPTTNRRSLNRSRWTLAASVALLLLGSLLLPSRFTPDAKPEPVLDAPGTADRPILPKRHESKPNESKPEVPVEDGDQLPNMEDADLPFLK